MTNTSLLQGKMRENNYTIKTLALKVGLSATGLFNKIHNQKEFVASEIQTIGELLLLEDKEISDIFFVKSVESKSTKGE